MTRINTYRTYDDEEAINMAIALLHRGEAVAMYNVKGEWFLVASYRMVN